jgi:hypothetical protein
VYYMLIGEGPVCRENHSTGGQESVHILGREPREPVELSVLGWGGGHQCTGRGKWVY